MLRMEIINQIADEKYRSRWKRGVATYAIELLMSLDKSEVNKNTIHIDLLNGAANWFQYSYTGCSLIYDEDIALRLCTISELKKAKFGRNNPNKYESWLDVQARALIQAERMIRQYLV